MRFPKYPMFARIVRRLLALALLPLTLVTGCRLYEAPIYKRLMPGANATHVLFIGNSLTYYNDLAGLVQQFSANEPRPMYVEAVTFPYASLDFHWNNGSARSKVERGGWQFVVLQEFSNEAATNPESVVEDYRRFGQAAARVGATPIIIENWTRQGRDGDAAQFDSTYGRVHEEIGGILAPVGRAWKICRDTHPEINLFEDDRHPTVAGTYLDACIIYRAIYQKKAAGLPTAIEGLKLPPNVAATLQQIADMVPVEPATRP